MCAKKKDEPTVQQQENASAPMPSPPAIATEEENETGRIRISDNVIAAIVRRYTEDIPGVVRFASGSIVSGLTEMLSKKSPEGSVVCVEVEDDSVNISVRLVLEFGVRIREVATMVQDVIRTRVEELTGNHVAKVDVIVQDLEDVVHEQDQDEAGAAPTGPEETQE